MLRTYLYIPEHLDTKIVRKAKEASKSKAEIIRQAIEAGFESMEKQKSGGAEVLLQLAEFAQKNNIKGPRDGSVNHDYYLWGFPKRNTKIKP